MTEPQCDDREIHTRFEQGHRSTMSHLVRRNPLLFQTVAIRSSLGRGLLQQEMNRKPAQRFAALSRKGDSLVPLGEFCKPSLENLGCFCPERNLSFLPSFSMEMHLSFETEIDLVLSQNDHF